MPYIPHMDFGSFIPFLIIGYIWWRIYKKVRGEVGKVKAERADRAERGSVSDRMRDHIEGTLREIDEDLETGLGDELDAVFDRGRSQREQPRRSAPQPRRQPEPSRPEPKPLFERPRERSAPPKIPPPPMPVEPIAEQARSFSDRLSTVFAFIFLALIAYGLFEMFG